MPKSNYNKRIDKKREGGVMLKVLKNLKNSWVAVIAIVILLCVQAATDLALPDYTSRIVNVGFSPLVYV